MPRAKSASIQSIRITFVVGDGMAAPDVKRAMHLRHLPPNLATGLALPSG